MIGLSLIIVLLSSDDSDKPQVKDSTEQEGEETRKSVQVAVNPYSGKSLEELRTVESRLLAKRQEIWAKQDQLDWDKEKDKSEIVRLAEEDQKIGKQFSELSEEIVKAKNQRSKLIKDKVRSQFSSWDGSHRLLVKKVKEVMHDPDSFAHDTTSHRLLPNDAGIQVSMIYRGKNAFGAVVRNSITAQFDMNGNFIKLVE